MDEPPNAQSNGVHVKRHTHLFVVVAVALTLFYGWAGPAAWAGEKPNILFIAIDDLRPELGCYGSQQAITPNIDQLASQGLRFNRAYCQVPICMGSRASLMTGILPTARRYVDNCRADVDTPTAQTLPGAFRDAGYTTLSNGKIFHTTEDTAPRSWSEPPWTPPVDLWKSHDPETTRRLSPRGHGLMYESADVPDNAYYDGMVAEKAAKDLEKLKESGKPFFLACGFFRPHMPFYAPTKYWDLYQRDKIALATNRFRPKGAPNDLRASREWKQYHPGDYEYNSDAWHRMMRHGYLASTSYVDKLTGDVLKKLEELGLADNTIVVIWGDHGFHLGEHDFWGKHNTMHLATRVPLLIRVPGKKPGVSDSLVETVDIFPTLCELAGVKVPQTVQGKSFVSLLDQPDKAFREVAYSRFKSADAVFTKRFSYTRFGNNNNKEMLYDLREDPEENVNLARDPAHAETVEKMRALLKQRQAQAAGATTR